jgi:hypothetical protein
MKRLIFALLGLGALAAAPSLAVLGDIVNSFPSPTTSTPGGLGRSNQFLHVLVYSSPNYVYNVNPTTGSIHSSWPTPRPSRNRGLAYSWGGHVWVGCYGNDYVYDCVWNTGSVNTSWNAGHDPHGLAPRQTGDGGAGTTALYVRDNSPSYIWIQRLTNGSVLSSFGIVHSSARDIAYAHRLRLIWGPYATYVYGYYSLNGAVVASFRCPASASVSGLAYFGNYLWVACSNRYIYQVHCPSMAVNPASLGRVKALFR